MLKAQGPGEKVRRNRRHLFKHKRDVLPSARWRKNKTNYLDTHTLSKHYEVGKVAQINGRDSTTSHTVIAYDGRDSNDNGTYAGHDRNEIARTVGKSDGPAPNTNESGDDYDLRILSTSRDERRSDAAERAKTWDTKTYTVHYDSQTDISNSVVTPRTDGRTRAASAICRRSYGGDGRPLEKSAPRTGRNAKTAKTFRRRRDDLVLTPRNGSERKRDGGTGKKRNKKILDVRTRSAATLDQTYLRVATRKRLPVDRRRVRYTARSSAGRESGRRRCGLWLSGFRELPSSRESWSSAVGVPRTHNNNNNKNLITCTWSLSEFWRIERNTKQRTL